MNTHNDGASLEYNNSSSGSRNEPTLLTVVVVVVVANKTVEKKNCPNLIPKISGIGYT